MSTIASPKIIGPTDGESVSLQTIGVRFMIPGADTDTRFSLVEHPMPPRGLAAPLHRHNREDEYSFVLEGRMGALLGDDVVEAGPGDLVYKPRGQWHTFWNAGDEPCRILEIISPPASSSSSPSSRRSRPAPSPTRRPSASCAPATPSTCSPRASPASAAGSASGSRASSRRAHRPMALDMRRAVAVARWLARRSPASSAASSRAGSASSAS